MMPKLLRRTMLTVLAAVVLVAGSSVSAWSATAGPTAAQPTLAVERVTGPTIQDAAFDGVSCPVSTWCMGVGNRLTTAGAAVPMAQRWNGTTWTSTSVPVPDGTREGFLSAISCTSTHDCLAVGHAIQRGGATVGLAVHWSGSGWSPVALAATRAPTQLLGVSCSTASSCVAVGSVGRTSGTAPLTEFWDGATWRARALPQVDGNDDSLGAVACAAPDDCLAVGTDAGPFGNNSRSLAWHWNGSSWTAVTVPVPAGATHDQLQGVSCPAAQACVVVGAFTDTQHGHYGRGFLEQWDGSALHLAARTAAGTQSESLRAVSCTAAVSCTVVGSGHIASSADTLAEHWDGATLTVVPTPDGASRVNSYAAVSCGAATSCVAVGRSDEVDFDGQPATPLTATYDGSAWTATTAHTYPAVLGTLGAVSCWAVGACIAVGGDQAYRRTASGWVATAPLPSPASDAFPSAVGVDCTSATYCIAVGTLLAEVGDVSAYAARWDGTSWHLALPSQGGPLGGVSCTSATSCVAIGSNFMTSQAQTWNGTSWTVTTLPSAHQFFDPADVSCTAATACTAVGTASDDDGSPYSYSTVYRLSGTTWSLQSDALASDNRARVLDVSCATARSCVAVATNTTDGAGVTEVWDGVDWTIAQPAVPSRASSVQLDSVSCVSATACTAVGTYVHDSVRYLVRESWNGVRWSLAPAQDPGIGVGPTSAHVDCVTVNGCAAVGTLAGPGSRAFTSALLATSSFG